MSFKAVASGDNVCGDRGRLIGGGDHHDRLVGGQSQAYGAARHRGVGGGERQTVDRLNVGDAEDAGRQDIHVGANREDAVDGAAVQVAAGVDERLAGVGGAARRSQGNGPQADLGQIAGAADGDARTSRSPSVGVTTVAPIAVWAAAPAAVPVPITVEAPE